MEGVSLGTPSIRIVIIGLTACCTLIAKVAGPLLSRVT